MRRLIIGIVALAIVLGGVLVVAPSFIDWSKYKPEIIGRVHDATGYDVSIDGALSMTVLPSPRLVVEKLSVASPTGSKEPLLALDRAEVAVALFPLLSGQVVVNKVYLRKPQIRMEVAADGTSSWLVPKKDAAEAAPAGAAPSSTPAVMPAANGTAVTGNAVSLNDVAIEDGSLTYVDHKAGKSYAVDKINLSLHGDTLSGPFNANGSVEYAGQEIKLSAKSGRLESGADSVALSADVELPKTSSKISYSGVVGLKGDHEIQGETDIDTASVKALASIGGASLPAALDKPLTAKGMLTASAAQVSYQNLKFTFGGADFTGDVSAKNLKGGDKPMAIEVNLSTDKPVDLTSAAAAVAAEKPAANSGGGSRTKAAAGSGGGFLPATMTLPAGMTASVKLSAPAVQYDDLKLKGVSLSGGWEGQKANGQLKADMAGGGNVDLGFNLSFGSASRSAAGGEMVLSDPVVTYSIALNTPDGKKALGPFVPKDKAKDILPLLKGSVALNAEGEVHPSTASVKKGSLKIQDTALAMSGSYTPGKKGGRDAIALTASADKIDADRWMSLVSPEKEKAAAPADSGGNGAGTPPKEAVKNAAKSLQLPIDLDLSLAANTVRWKGQDYSKFAVIAKLEANKLVLKTLQAQDPNGNGILAAGTIGDVSTLKDLDINLQGKTSDLKKLAVGFDQKYATLPDTLKQAELRATLKGQTDRMNVVANVSAMDSTLDASGTVADPLENPTISGLTLRLKSANYADLVKFFNPGFHAATEIKKNLDIYASVKREGDVYSVTGLQATVGPSTFTGDVTADMSGAKPAIKAKLTMGNVPLNELIGHEGGAQSAGEVRAQSSGGGGGGSNGGSHGRWSTTPIDADVMRNFDVDLSATVKSLTYGTWQVTNGVADVTLKEGTLTVTKLSGGMYGGQISLNGKLVAPEKTHGALTADGSAQFQNVALESFVSSFSGGSHLVKASGNVSVNMDVKTVGNSPAAMISALSGQGTGDGKNIVFQGFDLARLSRTLAMPSSSVAGNITSVLTTTMSGGNTSFDTLDSKFTITKGIVSINPLNLTGKDANIASPGTVDLPNWRIDMTSTITLAEPKDAPPLKMEFKGPLDQPAKAFGQNALNAYFGGKVQNMLLNTLQKKGILPGLPAPTAAQPAAGGQAPATQPTQQQQAQPQQQSKKVKPADVFKGMLQGVLQGQ
ncbi:MAG TPA: AsmA family protein [Patescibacteria group bacterium]|nr:AsmA family protein [Patescibacteria group bacterium]